MNDVRGSRRIVSPVSEKVADRDTTRLGGRRGRKPNGIPKPSVSEAARKRSEAFGRASDRAGVRGRAPGDL